MLDDVSGVFGHSDIGLKLVDVAKQVNVVGARDNEKIVSSIKDLAIRVAEESWRTHLGSALEQNRAHASHTVDRRIGFRTVSL